MNPNYAAAFGFRHDDLFETVSDKLSAGFAHFKDQFIYIDTADDQRYFLFADVRSLAISVNPLKVAPMGEVFCDPIDTRIPVYFLTKAELDADVDPETGGLRVDILLNTKGPISYTMGVFEDDLGNLDIDKSQVRNPSNTTADDKEGNLSKPDKYFIGARRKAADYDIEIDAAQTIKDWAEANLPGFRRNMVSVLFPDVRVVDDASAVVPNVRLYGEIKWSWDRSPGDEVDMMVVGSETASFHTPECPTILTQARIDPKELEAAQKSVTVGNGTATFNDIKVTTKSNLSAGFREARRKPMSTQPMFLVWLSKPLLSKTFDARVGDKLSAMLGVHKSDRSGAIKWYFSGAWLFEGYKGNLDIDTASAKLKVRVEGGTKFDALAYIDIGCVSYKLGDMDAFHEDFDFTINSALYVSDEGQLVFVGGLDELYFAGWHCFIDTFLDRYNTSWQGIIAEIVVKYVIGLVIQNIVEGSITDAMGYLTMNLLDIKSIPIAGKKIVDISQNRPGYIVSTALPSAEGLQILVGLDG